MGIESTEFLEDRVRVHYFLKKPWGVPDEDDVDEIIYDTIDKLPEFEELPEDSVESFWKESFHVPNVNKDIIYVFGSYPEKCAGPREETIKGIYQAKDMHAAAVEHTSQL